MTDYQEEQNNEMEALESIYPDELTVISKNPYPSFQVQISGEAEDTDFKSEGCCALEFTYTEKYPDESPGIDIKEYDGLEEEQVNGLIELMKEQAEENLGMAMVFTLVSAAQERLTELMEENVKSMIEEKESKERAIEEEERKKFEGTRVTIETFLAWKTKFDEEMAEIRKKKGIREKDTTKLTGKELFMQDHTLDDSDVKFLDEEDADAVKVDESLFQELDDLDLDEELDLEDS